MSALILRIIACKNNHLPGSDPPLQTPSFNKKFAFLSHLGYIIFSLVNWLTGGKSMKTQTTIRIDRDNYAQAKEILKYLGLSYSQAINIFNSMVVSKKGIPFEIKLPNEVTLQAMKEADELNGEFVTRDDFKKQPVS
jgi:DNA-damage-inducible protein J